MTFSPYPGCEPACRGWPGHGGRLAVSQRFCRCSAGVLPWPAAGGLASIDRRPSAQLGQERAFLSGDTDGAEPGHPAMLASVKANSLAPPLMAFFNN